MEPELATELSRDYIAGLRRRFPCSLDLLYGVEYTWDYFASIFSPLSAGRTGVTLEVTKSFLESPKSRLNMNHSRGQSPTPHSSSKYHHPYFTPAEVEYLSEKQRGKMSVTHEERSRQNACAFLDTLGARMGL
jgi:hypothetical protein